MPSSPVPIHDQHPYENTPSSVRTHEGLEIHDELDLVDIAPTPTRSSVRKALHLTPTSSKGRRVNGKWKGKRPLDVDNEGGECHLLNLPEDVIHLLLSRLPPRTLTKLAQTCRDLYEELEDETIWKQSYANHFLWEGAARNPHVKRDVKVLVQGCLNSGGRGWKREALSREAMIDRWIGSKAGMVMHTPPTGLIHTLSLSYPPFVPTAPKSLVVGKNHQTPTKTRDSTPSGSTPFTPQSEEGDPSSSTIPPTPTKLTHRQKYEAILAATTRPPPYVLSASLGYGGVVRSDPISGKVSKGFWGPGRDANDQANFHHQPHLDPSAEPSSLHLSSRSQNHILWGLRTGACVHTSIQSRHHATHGGRAASVNVYSDREDAHVGEINNIWQPEEEPQSGHGRLRWVTAGQDGRLKLWNFNPAVGNPRSGKRTPGVEVSPASISCLFTSDVIDTPPINRSEAVKRRQSGSPDAIILARYDAEHDVVCGVTEDGDLRVWFDTTTTPKELRVDVGAAEIEGGVKSIALDVRLERDVLEASVLVHHHGSPILTRYIVAPTEEVKTVVYTTPTGSSISTIHTSFRPIPAIAASPNDQALSARIVTPSETPETSSPPALDLPSSLPVTAVEEAYGRFVVAGDVMGFVHIWAWDDIAERHSRLPLRSWEAMGGKVTSLDYSCGLIAVGSYDGYIKVFDPLPSPPTLLRTFHASRLSPGEALVAASDDPDSRFYTVNKIVLESDLVVATIGRKVFAWRAGTGKGRQGGKEANGWRKSSTGRGDGKGSSRGLDMKAIHQAAVDEHADLGSPSWGPGQVTSTSKAEAKHLRALEEMGLEGEEALQYALMISMEDRGRKTAHEGDEWEASVESDSISSAIDACTESAQPSTLSTTPQSRTEYTDETGIEDGGDDDNDADGMDDETREAIRQVEAFKRQEEDELERMLEMIRVAEAGRGGAEASA